MAELDFGPRRVDVQVHREMRLEHRLALLPVDNGVELGQLDGGELTRPQHVDHWHEQQRLAEEAAAAAAEAAANAAEGGGEAAAATAAADPNDPLAAIRAMVPAHLLEKSAAARARLTGG